MRALSATRSHVAAGLYLAGLVCLSVMAFLAAWPDLEASLFDPDTALSADARLSTLRCPLILAADEVGTIRVRLVNPTSSNESFLVRSRISQGFVTLWREESQQVTLAPHAARELTLTIRSTDAAYGRFVMARVLALRGDQLPARQGACGTLVVGVRGVPGIWLFIAPVLLGMGLIVAAATCWWRARRPLAPGDVGTARLAAWLAALVLASLTTGVLGHWLTSHLLLLLALLSVVIGVEQSRLAGR